MSPVCAGILLGFRLRTGCCTRYAEQHTLGFGRRDLGLRVGPGPLGRVVRHGGAALSSSRPPGAWRTSRCVLGTSKEPMALTG